MRSTIARVFPLVLAALAAFGYGCTPIGNRVAQDARRVQVNTGTPNTLTMTDADGQWTANSTGASGWTAVDAKGIERFNQGGPQRELYYDRDTGRLVLSSGTDIHAKGIAIDPHIGSVQIAEFSTVTSTPALAQAEAFRALESYWLALTEAQKAAHIADVEAAQAAGDALAPVLLQLFKAAASP